MVEPNTPQSQIRWEDSGFNNQISLLILDRPSKLNIGVFQTLCTEVITFGQENIDCARENPCRSNLPTLREKWFVRTYLFLLEWYYSHVLRVAPTRRNVFTTFALNMLRNLPTPSELLGNTPSRISYSYDHKVPSLVVKGSDPSPR